MNKRGLSDVVTTLIIILISLVAVGIVWVVVSNVLESGSEEVDLGQFSLDLAIESVKIQDGNVAVVLVKREVGKGNFTAMDFIFSDGQNSETIRVNESLTELGQKTFMFTLQELNTSNLKEVSVIPVLISDSGKETIGKAIDTFEISSSNFVSNITGTGSVISENLPPFEALGYSGVGEKVYSIPASLGELISFTQTIVNPLDVLPGDNQTFTVNINSTYEIVEVSSVTELDNSILYLHFSKQYDFEGNSGWIASWIVNDTHTIEYRTNVTAIDSQGNLNSVLLTWTDSCNSAILQGTDRTLSSSCTTGANSIGGLDGGKLTISDGVTLTLDSGSKFVYNDGKSISIPGTGKIVQGGGGSLVKGYLYYPLSSGTTAVNATPTMGVTVTAPNGYIRVNATTVISSCTSSTGLIVCSASCSDPDGGQDYYTPTTVTSYSGACTNNGCTYSQESDVCLDTNKLNERYCSGNTIVTTQFQCQVVFGVDCLEGYCNEVCFLPGTMITLADGSKKAIEDVKVGEYVLSYNEASGELVSSQVTKLDEKQKDYYYIIEFSDKSQIEVTDNHPFYTLEKGWASINPKATYEENPSINAKQMNIGDNVKTSTGYKRIIGWIKVIGEEPVTVYNLKNVQDTHTFFAEDSLVHNKCVKEGTLIDMLDGSQKRVEDVQVGDKVVGGEVIKIYKKEMLNPIAGKILGNGQIVTGNHIIEYNGEFVKASETDLQDIEITTPVYDIGTTSGYYSVDGIMVRFGN